jgi:wyosine [tRNA(Phe)-imidazoG37] synthetase (radical SAM superfamily)
MPEIFGATRGFLLPTALGVFCFQEENFAMSEPAMKVLDQHTAHPRTYHANRFVYPVLSRRAKGISIGINLNPDKICNFDCVYCQVDRRSDAETPFVETDRLFEELEWTLDLVTSGKLFSDPKFCAVPPGLRRLNDVAFSGDGEPTTVPNFPTIVERTVALLRRPGRSGVKLVLLTNASMFHRPQVQRAIDVLMQHNGEIWAKLDAGTAEYYQQIDRTPIPFRRIIENLRAMAARHPLVIQSMFLRLRGEGPAEAEIDAYVERLKEIGAAGRVSLVQVYTVARPPAETYVTALTEAELEIIADRVRHRVGVPVEVFAGSA